MTTLIIIISNLEFLNEKYQEEREEEEEEKNEK